MPTLIEQIAEKKKDYRNLLFAQFFILFIYLALKDIFILLGLNSLSEHINFFYLLAAGTYFILLWDMIKNFTEGKIILNGILFVLVIDFTLGVLGENSFYPLIKNTRPFYLFIHTTLMLIEWTAISYAIKDLFSANQETTDKLWCSAALYLMIGITFGSMYDIINIINSGSFGRDVPLGFQSYIEGIYFSLSIQSTGSPPYTQASSLHKGIGVLQSVWNNLYMVMLIGRILVQTEPEKT